jgi:hypothetical protein
MNDAVTQAILALSDVHGGRLTPEQVVSAARDRRSPLHAVFEWDDKKAAASHRLFQARVLIKSVRLTIETTELSAPRRVPAFGTDVANGAYATLDVLRQDPDAARDAAIAEFARAASALKRARQIAVELGLGQEAAATITSLVSRVERAGEGVFAARSHG